jgi:GPH family glycoside/pentoside/hexuronide:cation symporter
MYTDCAEYSEWKTGNQVTALVVAASMFSLKFGGAMGAAIPGYVLELVGFVPNETQSETAIQGIRILMSGLPVLFFVVGGLAFLLYQLDWKAMAKVEAGLAERRGDQLPASSPPV